jgi:hypothetical protein
MTLGQFVGTYFLYLLAGGILLGELVKYFLFPNRS